MLSKPRFSHQSAASTMSTWMMVSVALNVFLLIVVTYMSSHIASGPCSSADMSPVPSKLGIYRSGSRLDDSLDTISTRPTRDTKSTIAKSVSNDNNADNDDDVPVDNSKPTTPSSNNNNNIISVVQSMIGSFGGADSSGVHMWTQSPTIDLQVEKDVSDASDVASTIDMHHSYTWQYCAKEPQTDYMPTPMAYCAQDANVEQRWQMSWFGLHVVPGTKRPFPKFMTCAHLPPAGYTWPSKVTTLPAQEDAVRWGNLRVKTRADLVVFNQATPKNLYHFDAARYDLDAMTELKFAAQYIPFGPKVRLMLDVGAGGGSLGLLLKRKYDTQVLSTVFADWPYCEYITERGGLCMLVDVMEPMPFAKFTFDVLHVSWVYHGQQPTELYTMFSELNRVLRPGGYLWMRGGWSARQITMLKDFLITRLGYTALFDRVTNKPPGITAKISFGPDLPYSADWDCVLVKPIQAKPADECVDDKSVVTRSSSSEVEETVQREQKLHEEELGGAAADEKKEGEGEKKDSSKKD